MGKNKKNRIKIGGLERQIDYHDEKIDEEMRRHNPNKELIKHWQSEAKAWKALPTPLFRSERWFPMKVLLQSL